MWLALSMISVPLHHRLQPIKWWQKQAKMMTLLGVKRMANNYANEVCTDLRFKNTMLMKWITLLATDLRLKKSMFNEMDYFVSTLLLWYIGMK